MGDLREPDGVVLEQASVSSSSPFAGSEVWARAETAAQDLIREVQPTVVSEESRRNVIDYVQKLLKRCLGCEVFPFGSVPLKTYLPDGDIDLTAFCGLNFEEAFAKDVYSVLKAEDHNPHAEFVVKDVQYIRAEVKLVKCLVQNIVVDISFNQIGGLCALCFLEQVDRLIGKDHLFKRSIILIKAWCYYESRILGAHHGLISTYALEILVLFIFHLFHSSLNGPLAVLHKFLDYFSKFDWDSFCVSLNGPVILASLPEIVFERPEASGDDLLLSDVFMRECVGRFFVPPKGAEMNYRTFLQKHLNIIDPLNENNNLGRSVSKGNFFRIRSAFSFGNRRLRHILVQPPENLAEEIRRFFTNTLDRHGKGQRPDVQNHASMFIHNGLSSETSVFPIEPFGDQIHSPNDNSICSSNQSIEGSDGSEDVKEAIFSISSDSNVEGIESENKRVMKSSPKKVSVVEFSDHGPTASASHRSRDANELATSRVQELRITEQGAYLSSSVDENRKLPLLGLHHEPHHYFSQSSENGMMENRNIDEEQNADPRLTSSRTVPGHSYQNANGFISQEHDNGHLCNSDERLYSRYPAVDGDAYSSQGSHIMYQSCSLLPDLSGDAESHLDNLRYGRWWYDQGLAVPIQAIHLIPPPLFQAKHPWVSIHQSVQLRQPPLNVNGVVPRSVFYPSDTAVGHFVSEVPTAQGIGAYYPSTNHYSDRDWFSPKGRYQGRFRSPRNNGRGPPTVDRSPQVQSFVRHSVGRSKFSDNHESSRRKVYKNSNGFVQASEYGPFRHPPVQVPLPETANCWPPVSDPSLGGETVDRVFVADGSRLSAQRYQLKDDDDFPPLSA